MAARETLPKQSAHSGGEFTWPNIRSSASDQLTARLKLHDATTGHSPLVIWSPEAEELHHPLLRTFAGIVAANSTKGVLQAEALDLDDFNSIKAWLSYLDVVDDGHDYRYRYWGSELVRNFGTDITGNLVSDLPSRTASLFLALYRSIQEKREAVLSIHEPPPEVFVRQWWRMMVPVVSKSGEVQNLLVAAYPQNELRNAFEAMPVPVVVADANANVRFANALSRQYFHNVVVPYRDTTIEAFCGTSIDLPRTPIAMVERGDTITTRSKVVRSDGVVHDCEVTLSGILQGNRAYYLLVLPHDMGAKA